MTPERAEWIRDNVWTQGMRKTHTHAPGYYRACACQWTAPCETNRRAAAADRCRTIGAVLWNETAIERRGGGVATFAELYRHPAKGGTFHSAVALVWLADRVCRWTCARHPADGAVAWWHSRPAACLPRSTVSPRRSTPECAGNRSPAPTFPTSPSKEDSTCDHPQA